MFGARAIQRRRDKEAELKAQRANGPPPAFVRSGPPGVKGGKANAGAKKGKKGGKAKNENYDLIVNIDLQEWRLSHEQVAELKEVFMLFDKDEDGVLSFQEVQVVMKSMGQRPSEEELLGRVREVSEDYIYDTLEFNEFLQMMSKQQDIVYTRSDLKSAFKIFDEDEDGQIHAADLVEVLTSFGDKLTKSEARKLVQKAHKSDEGLIDYQAFCDSLLPPEDETKEAPEKQDKAKHNDEEDESEKGEPSKAKQSC